jgi:hypothetical protein
MNTEKSFEGADHSSLSDKTSQVIIKNNDKINTYREKENSK